MNSAPQLLVVPNFLSDEELEMFGQFFVDGCNWTQPGPEADYRERQHWSSDLLNYGGIPELEDLLSAYSAIGKRKKDHIESFFGETVAQPRNMALRKWVPGDYQSPHSDVGHPDGTLIMGISQPEHAPLSLHQYDIAAVLYLNDDYDGGETYFLNQGIAIKPRRGMFVAFPSSHHYLHGVSEVRSGIRYVMTSFWPYSRTIIHNLIPSLPSNWWFKFSNPEEILDMIPEDAFGYVNRNMLPPRYER